MNLNKHNSIEMANELKPYRSCHCAVSLDNCVIIIGGRCKAEGRCKPSPTTIICIYNLHTEEWRKHVIPDPSCAPEPFQAAVAAPIGKTIYTFGGIRNTGRNTLRSLQYMDSTVLWTLSRTKEGSFTWSSKKQQCKHNSPSPRAGHAGWEYQGKLWIFAGCAYSPQDYLNDHGDSEDYFAWAMNNQLLSYDPNTHKWTNPQCFGSIPKPRSNHACAIINDKVWLFGGNNWLTDKLGDFFELRMNSLTWSQIQTGHPSPQARTCCTLTAGTMICWCYMVG